tara:strand:- start:389 stop:817 length:429 start_codon:yes stop_codon:yes gene_type:complete
MEPLSPLVALSGGLLIGLSAALLLLLTGRVAGISGLFARALGIADSGPSGGQAVAFILGLPLGAWLVASFVRAPEIEITSSLPLLIAAGLLVGFGTRLSNGCTSGHGVCGIGRLSPRSLAATGAFMGVGFLVVGLLRHVVGG